MGTECPPFEQPRERKQQGWGSGFIISNDGYILTNHHVVGEADTITVRLNDEREFDAEIVGTDPRAEVALIKIEDSKRPGPTPPINILPMETPAVTA